MVDVDRDITINGATFPVKGNRWTRIFFSKTFEVNTTKNIRVLTPYSRKRRVVTDISTNLIDELRTDINTLYYRNLQVERGNVPTDYNLTPEELEDSITRTSTEIKQLSDSISLIARRNEQTGRLEVTPESIVQAIDTTDGVGKLKTVKVTVDENGLTVDDGALIIRDSQNTAIITSDGLKIMFTYTSSGELNGWQFVGIVSIAGMVDKETALLIFSVPDKLNVTKATLTCFSMPAWRSGESFPDGYYHARNLKLYKSSDPTDGYLDFPADSSYGVTMRSAGYQDITSAVWGANWTPSGDKIVSKVGDVTNFITPGEQHVFAVETIDEVNLTNARYMGAMQMSISIEGYLRG